MAKERVEKAVAVEHKTPSEHKSEALSFNVWFSMLVQRRADVKPHHMSAIKAHFKSTGIGETETQEAFEAGLKHYGK